MLEDEFGDIIKKASSGLKISSAELSDKTGVSLEDIKDLISYKLIPSKNQIKIIAEILKLNEEKLTKIVLEKWEPSNKSHPDVIKIEQEIDGSKVNSYIIKDYNEALIIDTGLDAKSILKSLEKNELVPIAILITHNHSDHISGIEGLQEEYICEVYQDNEESMLKLEDFKIKVLKTPGHTFNHNCFLYKNYCFVGDLLFAGSIGGSNEVPYQTHLESIRKKILSLPDSTLLFPGHGPVTSVKEEKNNNPFF